MHDSSFQKMQAFVERYLANEKEQELIIVDVGARSVDGSSGYRKLFNCPCWTYYGLDVEAGHNVDIVVQDPYKWTPVTAASVDVVISGQVLEHVEFPWRTMDEIVRVLKPGGICCLIVPSAGAEHRYPLDCWRIYPDGMRALAKHAGLEVIEVFTEWGVGQWQDTFAVLQLKKKGQSGESSLPALTDLGISADFYRQALKTKPDAPTYYAHLDLMEVRNGKPAAAAAALQIGVEVFPENAYLRMRLIAVLCSMGIPAAALEHGKSLIKMPASINAVKVLENMASRLGHVENEYLAKCLVDVPMGRIFQLAELAGKEGAFALEAICWCGLSQLQPNEVDYRVRYGLALCGVSDGKAGRAALNEALQWQLSKEVVNRTTIVQRFIDLKGRAHAYLEIGVERGTNFLQIRAPLKVAVDPAFKVPGGLKETEGEVYVETTSDVFFLQHPHLLHGKVDVVFIDGLHTYEQALKDVENALRHLAGDGVIVMHDCLPVSEAEACKSENEARQRPDFKNSWTGDVFRAVIDLRAHHDDLEVFVVDVDHGVGVIRRKPLQRTVALTREQIENMSYKEFFSERRRLLGLKNIEEYKHWLENY